MININHKKFPFSVEIRNFYMYMSYVPLLCLLHYNHERQEMKDWFAARNICIYQFLHGENCEIFKFTNICWFTVHGTFQYTH